MKNKLMNALKVVAASAALLFIALLIWANWNAPTPAQKLEPKAFALFDMSNVKDTGTLDPLNAKMLETKGIAATSVRKADKLLSVVYYTDIISQADILAMLNRFTNTEIVQREIKATGPTCPVAGLMGTFSMLKRSLCFRK